MGKSFRMPNGFGSIYKLSENRRKPYAIAVTSGYNDYGQRIRKIIGYADTRSNALTILSDYNKNPFDINIVSLTFENIFDMLLPKLEKMVEQEKMSSSNLKNLKSAYKNQCVSLYKEKILDLKTKKMQEVIDSSNVGFTMKGYIKNLCTKIFEYLIVDLEYEQKINPASRLKIGDKKVSKLHFPFTAEEKKEIFEDACGGNEIAMIIAIYLYSGMRPQELIKIVKEKVLLHDKYMIGGSKTKAGKNRIIPIHEKTLKFVEHFFNKNKNNKYLITINKNNLTYDNYLSLFTKYKNIKNINHTPYDTRHTFATDMANANANEFIIKLIMGHSIADVTESVYIHRDIDSLLKEINLLK